MHLALFGPGREVLERHAGALDKLRALANDGLAKETREHASRALAAVEGLAPGSAPTPRCDEKHVMMSCMSCTQHPWMELAECAVI